MRDYLFRGKRVDNGEWVYGSYIRRKNAENSEIYWESKPDCRGYYADDVNQVIPETVGQYTGYDDYFDGDIIKSEQDGVIGVIRFGEYQNPNCSGNGECHLGFSIEWFGKYSDILRRDLGWWIKAASENIKKIGNIHDNPELLEVEK